MFNSFASRNPFCSIPARTTSFSSKFGGFPYPLLADTEKKIINSFGVWGFKKFMGKEYEGILRTTFVVDEKLTIIKVIEKVKTKDHSSQILEW